VRLRPLRRADGPLLYDWIVDRELCLLNSAYYPVSESDHEAWLESMMRKRQDLTVFAIEECASGAAIGTCQLLHIDCRHRNAELQIRIGAPAARGRGLGSEAVRLLVDFGFRDLNLHRIYLHVFATNARAIAAYRKCGFATEGRLREAAFVDGAWVDLLIMALLRTGDG
jgi:RimJ/RimL family protein N-acetyltransferase